MLTHSLVSQTIGGAFFVTAGQVAFTNVLVGRLRTYAPEIDPATVIATGATEVRKVFPATALPEILASYMEGLNTAYAIGIAAAGLAAVISLFSKWRNIKPSATMGAV